MSSVDEELRAFDRAMEAKLAAFRAQHGKSLPTNITLPTSSEALPHKHNPYAPPVPPSISTAATTAESTGSTSVRQMAELEGKVKVQEKLIEFLQGNLARAQDEQQEHLTQTANLEKLIEQLQEKLKEKDKALVAKEKEKEAAVQTKQGEIENLKRELASQKKYADDMNSHLNKSYNETLDSHRMVMEQAEEEKRRYEDELAEKEFRVTETQRVSRFLQSKLEKLEKEKAEKENEAAKTIANLEFNLSSANRVANFAQKHVVKVRDEMAVKEHQTANEIATLKFQASEGHRMATFLQKKLEDLQAKTDEELTDQKNQLTAAHQLVRFLEKRMVPMKEKVTKLEAQVQSDSDQITELTKQLTLAQGKASTFLTKLRQAKEVVDQLQATNSDLIKENDNLRVDRFALSMKIDDYIKEIQNSKDQVTAKQLEIENLHKDIRTLTGKLQITDRMVEYLQSAIAAVEEERIMQKHQHES